MTLTHLSASKSLSSNISPNIAAVKNNMTPTLSDEQLDRFIQDGFYIWDNFLPLDALQVIQQECLTVQHQSAQVHGGVHAQHVRSDSTCWINPHHRAYDLYLTVLEQLIPLFNQAFFAGISWTEAHYAHYAPGQFYAAHRDNASGSNIRAISSVFYLNNDWQEAWGGQLCLEGANQVWQTILPLANRLVLFRSDLLHEVKPTTRDRHSITGWMRRDEPV